MKFSKTDIGALLMVGLPGAEIDEATLNLIRDHGIRNFIIFRRNVENPGQLKKLCTDLIEACVESGLGRPLISIDQEGGSVARLNKPWTQFTDARILAESHEPESSLTSFARTCANELLEMGINMNLAPVLDVCPAGEGYFMERRSLGSNPLEVARLGCLVITEMQNLGLAACAKHYPGLGAAKLDPHLELPLVEKSRDLIMSEDLFPFREAARCDVASIMTSHTIYQDIDPHYPATLSKNILTDILREDIGYNGLIITDDLEMGAIERERTVADAALLSFEAGADMLLVCHDQLKMRDTVKTLATANKTGRLASKRISESLNRVETVRKRFG